MPLILTENAANQVRKFQEEHQFPQDAFLRIGLVAGGCSGFSYSLAFDDKYDEEKDSKFDQHGVSIVVDKKSASTSTEQPSIGTSGSTAKVSALKIHKPGSRVAAAVRSPCKNR